MATYKNATGFGQSIARDGIEYHVADGATVDVPDDDVSFDGRPGWVKSQTKSPDVTVDPELAATAAVPPADPASSSAA